MVWKLCMGPHLLCQHSRTAEQFRPIGGSAMANQTENFRSNIMVLQEGEEYCMLLQTQPGPDLVPHVYHGVARI